MFYSLFLCAVIDRIYKNIPVRIEGGWVRQVRVRTQWGAVACARVRTMGRGSNFCDFGAYVLIE